MLQGLADCRDHLSLGRFAAARDLAMVSERWGERSGDLTVIAQAQLLSGLASAALGEHEAARARLRPAIAELDETDRGVAAAELFEGQLALMRLDWLAGRDDAALAAWYELRPGVEGSAAWAADLFLSEACLQAAMPAAAQVHAQRALIAWRGAQSPGSGELDAWCRYGRCLGWAGSFDGEVPCRVQAGIQAQLLLARCAYLAGDETTGQRAETRARELWPGPGFEQAASLWPARLRLALAREDQSAVENLVVAAETREALSVARQDDLQQAWQLDWSASIEPWKAAQARAAVGVVEASWTALDGMTSTAGSLEPPPLLERRERLREWLEHLAPDWMPLPLASFSAKAPGAGGLLWVPLWVRALGVLGGLGLSVLGGVTLLQSRRSRLLEKRLSELERARESLVREAAAMSHDLKSPVLTMRCALDLLGLDSSDPSIASRVAPLEQSLDHILRLADRSMELHLLRTGVSDGSSEALEMISFARSVVDRWRPLASEKRIQLRFEAQPGAHGGLLWELPRDHAERLLDNLISNGIKYSYPGGRVEVCVGEELTAGRREGVLSVRDTGVGLHAAELPRFFEPLSGLSSAPTDGEPSTGLGTAIIEAVASRYGGKAQVAAREDRSGLSVSVRWPLD
ncbi:MAG: sensor histidine kinase [Planctomycetota bacterium]